MEMSTLLPFAIPGFLGLVALTVVKIAMNLRRVVSTNEVHIVQSAKNTTSYGKDTGNGNTYYEWPSWIPVIGVSKTVFQVSNFDIDLEDYEAYDEGRLPFVVDVKAFFRITQTNIAAQRVSSFEELTNQLRAVVQGAVRTVLAANSIEEIMQGRSKFGDEFTKEVDSHLSNWGVSSVRNIELMDIRDHAGSKVIQNIMEKKKSLIEMQSRTEVAKNIQAAKIAEIDAQKSVDLQSQEALQQVGLRTTQNKRAVALAEQEAIQSVKEQEKTTKEKEMAVAKVQQVRTAEIARDVQLLKSEQDKATAIIAAEGQKTQTVLASEGALESTRREAEGLALVGKAKADAERAMLLAPVEAQTTLAKEIGENQGYQKYLITIRQVEAQEAVGKEQAKALEQADVKIISNTGSPTSGLNNVMDLFSSKGGTELGSMLEALKQTEIGQELLGKLTGTKDGAPEAAPKAGTKK